MSAGSIVILFIWIAISVISSAQKKKQREQKRQSGASAETRQAEPAARPARRAPRRTIDDIFPELTNADRTSPVDDRFPDLRSKTPKTGARGSLKPSVQTSMSMSAEGSAIGGSLEGTAAERATLYSNIEADVGRAQPHVVKPVTESSHRHVESSLEGIQGECALEAEMAPTAPLAPDASQAYVIPDAHKNSGRRFAFDRSSAVQGILYGEILGKPKALRR